MTDEFPASFWEDDGDIQDLPDNHATADLTALLKALFPNPDQLLGTEDPEGRAVVMLVAGSHTLHFRAIPEGHWRWHVVWNQDMEIFASIAEKAPPTLTLAEKILRTEQSMRAWLSGVHHTICKQTAQDLQKDLDPDHFIPDFTQTLIRFGTLYRIGATWEDIQSWVTPGLHWLPQETNLKHEAPLLYRGVKVGWVNVGFKGKWRYGYRVHKEGGPEFKDARTAPTSVVGAGDIEGAKDRAARFFCRSLITKLLDLASLAKTTEDLF